jgi:hypothetical protein
MTVEAGLRIARRRMHTQHLAGPRLATPEDVVGWLGAAQSQEYGPAKWSLGQRSDGVSDDDVEESLAGGAILRTHVLRPTWHFVLPADIGWMLELTAPRVLVQSAYQFRQQGLDEATLRASSEKLARALRGGNHLMRKELKAVLEKAGIDAGGLRLGLVLLNAELRGLICSGARRGKQHTYALLEERAPNARELDRDHALAELTLRYFTSHGPATIKDFGWWSSLKITDIKQGLEMVGPQLNQEEVNGIRYWFADSSGVLEADSPEVHLLQTYDEYVVAYKESRHLVDVSGLARSVDGRYPFVDSIALDSQLAGHWKRTFKKDEVLIEVALYAPFDEAATQALHTSASEYANFVGRRALIETTVGAFDEGVLRTRADQR